MIFRTNIQAPQYPFKIDYSNTIMLLGSCFSDNIGSYFTQHRFTTQSNPFGVLFNPISIDHALRMLLDPNSFDKSRYFYKYRELWVSFAHHGQFSNADYGVFEQNIDTQLLTASQFLRKTDYLFITFGTAFCYKFIPRDIIVANCHKIPNYQFNRFRLDTKTILQQYRSTIQLIKDIRPSIKIIFTVSPIRHISDGMHDNELSKSILQLAVDKLVDNETTFYFPAYEFLIDDLRDYRFYAKDLCHPNDLAIEYVTEKISESFYTPETVEKIRAIEQENKFLNHKKLRKE